MLSQRQERLIKRVKIETAIELLGMILTQAQLGVEINSKWLERELRKGREELRKLNDN